MKISLQWLKRYVSIDKSLSEIEEALTLIGFEVEGVETIGLPPLSNIVVGKILASEKHPNADKLSVCKVTTDRESEPHTIVCGAKNYKIGDRIPVALPGAVLPGNFKIKRSKLRGVRSEGMMCSASELGLGEDHSGLLILSPDEPLGKSINEVFPDNDTVFDIEVTPNRPDCLSHIGIAREMAAYFGLSFHYPETQASPESPFAHRAEPLLQSVKIETWVNCPHYRGYSIRGVTIKESPEWLKTALLAIGLRPINNVVDVTNFVLHELGQPLHAFDASKIKGDRIIIRQARKGEKITTLDEKPRELHPDMMVIADTERALVIAGVMGSLDAEVDDNTTDIVLESAYFNPTNIRWTSRKLGLSTDSSYRFERGVDPLGAEFAALRAIDLILEVAGGELAGLPKVEGNPRDLGREIDFTPDYIRKHLGFDVSDKAVWEVLESLQLEMKTRIDAAGNTFWQAVIPSFRLDLERPIDLVEEFLRIYGTDKIPETPVITPGIQSKDDPVTRYVRKTTQYLQGQHFLECYHYSMRSRDELKNYYSNTEADSLKLANPLASDQSHLRPCLIPGLLDALKLNQSRLNTPEKLFESGRIFREDNGKLWEMVSLSFVIPVNEDAPSWLKRDEPDFYTAATLVRNLFRMSGIDKQELELAVMPPSNAMWQTGQSAMAGSVTDGFLAAAGLLDLRLIKSWDIRGKVLAGSVCILPEKLRQQRDRQGFQPFSQYPPATRDLALVVDSMTSAGEVEKDLRALAEQACADTCELEQINIFDVYSGKGLEENKKSLAYSLRFRSNEKTLKDSQVNKVFDKIIKSIKSETPYSVRS